MKAVEEDKGMIFGSKEEWEKGRHSPRPDEIYRVLWDFVFNHTKFVQYG